MKKAKRAKTTAYKKLKRKPVRKLIARRKISRKIPVLRKSRRQSDRVWLVSLTIGIVIFSAGLLMKAHEAARLTFYGNVSSLNLTRRTGSVPSRLLIPSIDVNLPVFETEILRGVWQINDKGVSHLATSSVPGTYGNIILYGHNNPERLGMLGKVAPGDRIIITTEDGNDRLYLVRKTVTVRPDDLSLVTNTPDETLTLYTCTGFADSKRLVVVAKPFGVPIADLP